MTDLIPSMMTLLSGLNILDYGISFSIITICLGVGLAFFDNAQDALGIGVIILFLGNLTGLNEAYWLTVLAALVYGLMVLARKEE